MSEIYLRKKLFVNGKGPIRGCRIAFVGEQPGKTEVVKGEPFVGPAGSVLSECCREAGVPRNECYLTNVIKDLDHPLEYYLKRDSRGKMTIHEDFNEYCQLLREELSKCTANVIVAVGNIALYALTERWGITRWRGSVLESTLLPGRKVLPTLHPATVIPPKMQYTNRYLIIFDLKRALIQGTFPQIATPQYPHFLKPSFAECVAMLEKATEVGLTGEPIAYDIEITNLEVSCISFAFKVNDEVLSVCIPFTCWDGDYFTPDQEGALWKMIGQLLENGRIPKLGQNLVFDVHFLLRKYGIRARNLHDTMIAQGITYPDFPKGLHFITSLYTDIPYYKDDGKFWLKGQGNWEAGWRYNALDSVACVEAFPKQLADLEGFGNTETYEHVRKRIPPLVYMMEHGVRVNVEGMTKRVATLETELAEKQEQLNKMAKGELNAQSSKQVMAYFYGLKGEKPYLNHKTHQPTSDDMAMKRLIRKGYDEARLILDIRSIAKTLSTYLDIKKIDSDGRLRCSYNPVGTRYSRLSSSESIFGTGCVKPDTEVLTRSGWCAFKNLLSGREIAQWDSKNGAITWVIPDIHKYSFEGNLITANSTIHKCSYTPNHRIPKITKRGKLHTITAEQAAKESNWFLPLSGILINDKEPVTLSPELIRVIAMVQADGSIEGNGIRLSFKKTRKIDRCIKLLNEAELEYTEQKGEEGYRRFYITTLSSAVIITLLNLCGDKVYGDWIFSLSENCRMALLDELQYWDATIRGRSFEYFTAIKQNAEWVATLAHITGYSATINKTFNNRYEESYGKDTVLWVVNVKPRTSAYQTNSMYSTEEYSGDVYCVTVPTSFFLCRSEDRIVVTGNSNMQNWPHWLLEYLEPDPGYIYYSFDLSQFENRIVAYVGRIPQMMQAFEEGKDVHSLTASLIFGKAVGDISDEDGSSTLGDGRHSERYWGKKANHGLNYGLGYRKFSLHCEIPESDGKFIYDRYHKMYPGVQQNYHAMVKRMLYQGRVITNLLGRKTLFLGRLDENLFQEAYACIPQSTCGDVIDRWGMAPLYYEQQFKPFELMLQVHDSIGFQCPLSVPWIEQAQMLQALKDRLEQPLTTPHGDKFVIPADLTIGFNLYKECGKEIKHKRWPATLNELALKLEETANELMGKSSNNH